MEVGKKGKVHVEDIVFLIRKDPKKYARVKVNLQWSRFYIASMFRNKNSIFF